MEIIQKEKYGIVCVTVKGRTEAQLTQEFEKVVKQIVQGDKRRLLFDLGALEYLRSSVLRVILNAVKELNQKRGKVVLCSLNGYVREIFEAKAQSNQQRLSLLKRFKEAGIETYTLICPVMPFITDVESLLEIVEPYSNTIWFYGLSMDNMKDKNWEYVSDILDQHFPGMKENYAQIAFSSSHPYWAELRQKLMDIQSKTRLNMRINL